MLGATLVKFLLFLFIIHEIVKIKARNSF